jgi:hypothetical protein
VYIYIMVGLRSVCVCVCVRLVSVTTGSDNKISHFGLAFPKIAGE